MATSLPLSPVDVTFQNFSQKLLAWPVSFSYSKFLVLRWTRHGEKGLHQHHLRAITINHLGNLLNKLVTKKNIKRLYFLRKLSLTVK